jgi:hypothetical protein
MKKRNINGLIKGKSFTVLNRNNFIYLLNEDIMLKTKFDTTDFSPITKLMELPKENKCVMYNITTKRTQESNPNLIERIEDFEFNNMVVKTNLFEKINNKMFEVFFNHTKDNYMLVSEQYTKCIENDDIMSIKATDVVLKFELNAYEKFCVGKIRYTKENENSFLR